MPMYLSDYDPDDPPASTHEMEADRLWGVSIFRLLTAFIVSLLVGIDPRQFGLIHLVDTRPLAAILVAGFILRALWPLLRSIEHRWLAWKEDPLFASG